MDLVGHGQLGLLFKLKPMVRNQVHRDDILIILSSTKPILYTITIQITIHPLSTDGAIVIYAFYRH